MSITVAQLASNLPPGVTLDPVLYPPTAQASKAIVDILDAFGRAQAIFNVTAPAGTDVLALNVGLGNEQTIFWPPGQTTTTLVVRAKSYSFNSFQQSQVTEVYPLVG